MYFEVKVPEKGRNNIFRDEQTTNKIPLMLLDVNMCISNGNNSVFGLCQ